MPQRDYICSLAEYPRITVSSTTGTLLFTSFCCACPLEKEIIKMIDKKQPERSDIDPISFVRAVHLLYHSILNLILFTRYIN